MKSSFVAAALIAGAVLSLHAAPAAADSEVQWSVTIGSPGYPAPVVVHQPPVVVHRHPRVIHRAPVYVPPPTVVYVPVQPVYPSHQPFLNTYAHPDRQQYRYEHSKRIRHSDRHWHEGRHHGHRHGRGHGNGHEHWGSHR